MTIPPAEIKIYHIVHVDRLPSIIAERCLWCDAEVARRNFAGTTIGMKNIKERRLRKPLNSHRDIYVGDCVLFYFCPRSIMLYVIHKADNPDLAYRDGQNHIVHLEADLPATVNWAVQNNRRWAFTTANAASLYADDHCDLAQLHTINWDAVHSQYWQQCKEAKQAEFLIERSCPWPLVSRIGVHSQMVRQQVQASLQSATHQPCVTVEPSWYY